MAKRTPQQNEAISKKIAILKAEGLRQDRAVAAAMRMYKEGKLKIPKKAAAQRKATSSIKRIATIKSSAKLAAALKANSLRKSRKKK